MRYDKYLRREIYEEFTQGTSVEDIAKITGKSVWSIKSALQSNWFNELKANMSQFMDEVALGNSDWYLELKQKRNDAKL